MNRKFVDEFAVEFCMSMNTKANRKKLARALFSVDKNRCVCVLGGGGGGREEGGGRMEGGRREEGGGRRKNLKERKTVEWGGEETEKEGV